ncbi:hypothetical protein GCK72_004726 [Caenorhabditis remanei]|uniref:Uncharacterized protein n=1 Tax=Caenorhabditis remanei TaxID=31234 RepID=A0A6A5HD67_CAERE|nr:hypothetical protein GCK72_004726 [Caenorhabditis remanei]KAF1764776.1 hypothetical protein GCK72_004726 [Caenorhabditis remanei]
MSSKFTTVRARSTSPLPFSCETTRGQKRSRRGTAITRSVSEDYARNTEKFNILMDKLAGKLDKFHMEDAVQKKKAETKIATEEALKTIVLKPNFSNFKIPKKSTPESLQGFTNLNILSNHSIICAVDTSNCSNPLSKVASRLLESNAFSINCSATSSPGNAASSTRSGLKMAQCGPAAPGIPAFERRYARTGIRLAMSPEKVVSIVRTTIGGDSRRAEASVMTRT